MVKNTMAYTYILRCKDGSYYVGATNDIEKRLERHQKGYSKYTKNKRPVELIYKESYKNKSMALKREKQIKSWKNRKAIERLIIVGPSFPVLDEIENRGSSVTKVDRD